MTIKRFELKELSCIYICNWLLIRSIKSLFKIRKCWGHGPTDNLKYIFWNMRYALNFNHLYFLPHFHLNNTYLRTFYMKSKTIAYILWAVISQVSFDQCMLTVGVRVHRNFPLSSTTVSCFDFWSIYLLSLSNDVYCTCN